MSDLTLRDKLLKSSGLVSESLLNKIDTDIAPNDPSNVSLGSEDKKFKAVYADEVHISQNTLYIGDTPVLGTNEDTINIKADKDQSILVKTTGIGNTQMSSEKGILLHTNGTTANIDINADGTNSEVTMNAKTRVSVTAPNIVLDGNTTITDLTVTGTTTTVNSTNLEVKDNIIEINSGETGSGVSLGTAGIKVNRGDELPYLIQFDEADDRFKVGKQGSLEIIASQNYVDQAVANVTFEHPETHPASMITGLANVATSGSYNDLSNKPTSLPANGGNAATVGGFTVGTNVPANAKFTDTTYTLGSFGVTATSTELNVLDGITATTAELNYIDGVTSNIQTQLNTKAPLASPALTGTPTAPTAAAGTNNTQVATTAFVTTAIANKTTVSGNAGSATKLATARTIDGVSFNGTANIIHYSTCSTAAATAAKTVALTGFTLATGASVKVKFTVTNTAANPTLNVNSTGAKAIMYRGSAISAGYLAANRVYEFVYDGTDWELVGDINTNTTYSNMTAATASAAGKAGLVPAPAAGKQTAFLRGDGTWVDMDSMSAGISTITITSSDSNWTGPTNSVYTYTKSVGTAKAINVYKKTTNGYEIIGPDSVEITSSGNIIITSPDKFDGYCLLTSTESFDSTAIDDVETMVINKTIELVNTKSVGTASALGLTKLYTSTGTNTDGTMTQAAIKTAIDNATPPDATTSSKGIVKVGSNITVSDGTISVTKTNITNAGGVALSSNVTVTASTQAAQTPSTTGQFTTEAAGTIKLLNCATGLGAGTYTLQNLLQQLVNRSHTHSLTSFTSAADSNSYCSYCTHCYSDNCSSSS